MTDNKKPLIPPHIAWPGLVVALLLVSVGANIGLVLASKSDNGAQAEEDYYQRALDWDERKDALAAGKWFEWSNTFESKPEGMTITVKASKDGEAVALKNAKVSYQHNALATRYEVSLDDNGQAPLEHVRPGLWNMVVSGEINGTAVRHAFTQEWTAAKPGL